MWRRWIVLMVFGVAVAAIFLSSTPPIKRALHDPLDHAGYLEIDREIVDLAIKDYAAAHHASISRTMRDRFPVVIHLEDQRCVSLKLRPGLIGDEPVYCYDGSTNRLVYRKMRPL